MTQTINPLMLRNFLKTKQDAIDMQMLIDMVNERLFKTDMSAFEILNTEAPYELGRAIARLAEVNKVNLQHQEHVSEFLASVHNSVTALPVVQITCAYAPRKDLLNRINDWFFATYNKSVLLDIIVDPDIAGGAKINYNGKTADYSLRKTLDAMQLHN
jgi:F0F1-type ATP synthase delta subunit